MKKFLASIILFLVATAGAWAQSVITGTVVDKNGTPIPGAKVEIVGSTESTITELDGTFRIETSAPARELKVRYVGMGSKKQEITPNMTIVLGGKGGDKEKFAVVVRAGAGLASYSFGGNDYIEDDEFGENHEFSKLLAPTISIDFEIPVAKNMLVIPSLSYKQKGFIAKSWEEYTGSSYYNLYEEKETEKLHYLQLSAQFAYRYHLNNTMSITAKVGSYMAYGIKAKLNREGNGYYEYNNGEINTESWSEEFDGFSGKYIFNGKEGEQEAEYNRLDYGFVAGLDFAWKKFILGIQYDQSLSNLYKDDFLVEDGKKYDLSIKNKGWYFTLGYRF